jgi:hypothetical protein
VNAKTTPLLASVRSNKKKKMTPFNNVQETINYIDEFEGKPEELVLAISDELQDAAGMNIALITDRILAKGWVPNSYKQESGYRLYYYKKME